MIILRGTDEPRSPTESPPLIEVDGRRSQLHQLPAGATVSLSKFVGHNSSASIVATGPNVFGLVKAVNAETKIITIDVLNGEREKCLRVAQSAQIEIDHMPVEVADVPTQVWASLSLSTDQTSARNIRVTGPQVSGFVKAIDAKTQTITVTGTLWKQVTGQTLPADRREDTFAVAKDAEVQIDGKPGQLSELPMGARVFLDLCLNQTTAHRIRAAGPQVSGFVLTADAATNVLTLNGSQWKEETGIVFPADEARKTFVVANDATIEIDGKPGRLDRLPTGARILLDLHVDHKTVRSIQAGGPAIRGTVSEVQARSSVITLTDTLWDPGTGKKLPSDGPKATFVVTKWTKIEVDGKRADLVALPVGSRVTLRLAVDQRTVGSIQAKTP